jgi:hypothetical protein
MREPAGPFTAAAVCGILFAERIPSPTPGKQEAADG